MLPTFQLILLPGLGADDRLLEPQRAAFPQMIVPPWIPPLTNESLPSYAARMAETVTVSRDSPLILGGVSMGGMMAYEMARHLKPDAVVLIASCRSRSGLRPTHVWSRRLLPAIPVRAWSVAKLLSGPVMRVMHRRSVEKREMLVRMFKEADAQFMHWALRAILNWESTPLEGVPVFQIHGSRDPIIPVRRNKADVIIPGGHLINVGRAEEVNAFIVRVAAMTHDIQAFRAVALEYCTLIDSLADGRPDHFYESLLDCMSRLAKSILDVPSDCCTTNVVCEGHRMTHDEWGAIVAQINSVIGEEVSRLIEADKDFPDDATRTFMLSDSLADIYRDLRDGLRFYDRASNGGMQEAAWQWKFGYEHHWGSHLFDAMHVVHRIRYELHEE
jgi:pimeloyl-ACP methyl ester carboxylesterase